VKFLYVCGAEAAVPAVCTKGSLYPPSAQKPTVLINALFAFPDNVRELRVFALIIAAPGDASSQK
jgi:hypothetical protein